MSDLDPFLSPYNPDSHKKIKTPISGWQYLKVIWGFFTLIFGSISIIALALGSTLTSWNNCTNWPPLFNSSSNPTNLCDMGTIGTAFLVLPFAFFFWRCPGGTGCEYHNNYCRPLLGKSKSWKTVAMFYLLSFILIFLSHIIGHVVNKHLFGHSFLFTWKTSSMGLTVYYGLICLISFLGAMCYVIHGIVKGLKECVEDHERLS
jgi:hypothetical protein